MSESKSEKWYVGAMNDCLFIIDQPPRPSNDDVCPSRDVKVIAKVGPTDEDHTNAERIARVPDLEARLGILAEKARELLDALARDDVMADSTVENAMQALSDALGS